jgi:hypothetical protein
MPSHPDRRVGRGTGRRHAGARLTALAALALLLSPPGVGSAPVATPPVATDTGSVPDDDAVQDAIAALRKDELMGGFTQERRLHWRDRSKPVREADPSAIRRLLEWLGSFARWVASGARAVVVVLAVIGAGLLGVLVVRAWRRGRVPVLAANETPPTHVRGLDIRPDELPADVPAAARALWARGDAHGALVLLYRALLSRLVHEHRAAIRDSSTEGDCLREARRCLQPAPLAYVAGLVACWQRARYAAALPDAQRLEALCAGFDAALPPALQAQP